MQKENDEELVTPRKKARSSAVDSPTGSAPSSKKKRKKEKLTPASGTECNAEQNDNLANGSVESAVVDESVLESQSNKKSSSKKRRKSKAGDSPATSGEVLNGSVAEDVNSSLHELTKNKKRRSLAAPSGEQDTPDTARKRKKNVTNSSSV